MRDFFRSPWEMECFREALESVPDDVWVYTKCVPNDWQYRYPPHPLLGKVAPHKQIMEIDLFNEVAGTSMTMPAPDYYQKQIQLARDCGLAGVIPRLDDGFCSNRGTPAEFNVYVYNRLVHNPDADVEAMWPAFFGPFYGKKAAPVAIGCLKDCFDLVCSIAYTLGFWTGGPGASIGYTDGHLVRHSSALWSDDPKYKETEELLIRSGPELIRLATEEKRNAEQVATCCLQKLDRAQRHFDPAKFLQLRGYFEEAQQRARIGQYWARAYFALRWYRNTKSPDAKAEAETALAAAPRSEMSLYVKGLDENNRKRFYVGRLPSFNVQMATAMAEVK